MELWFTQIKVAIILEFKGYTFDFLDKYTSHLQETGCINIFVNILPNNANNVISKIFVFKIVSIRLFVTSIESK